MSKKLGGESKTCKKKTQKELLGSIIKPKGVKKAYIQVSASKNPEEAPSLKK